MTDLVESLRAALDAAHAEADAANQDSPELYPANPVEFILAGQDITTPATEAAERHIRAWTPAAVLRRIAAERKTLAEHADDGHGDCVRCAGPGRPVEVNGTVITEREAVPHPCATVRNIAEGWGWTGEAG